MLDVTVKVQAPELAQALLALATAMNATHLIAPIQTGAEVIAPPAQLPPVTPAPVVPAVAPIVPTATPTQPPAPTAPAMTTVAPPPVPTAAAPTYNRDQIMTAGAALIDAGKINELMGLLGAFGVQAVTQLKPEQIGAFATELRKLGAQL